MLTFDSSRADIHFPSIKLSFVFFAVIIFFHTIGDSIMSFMSPNLIESIVDNQFLMGLIFSFSSVVGLVADYFYSNMLSQKSALHYSVVGVVIAISFPIIFLIKENSLTALLAMAIWGIYYELIVFAKSNYIHHHLAHDQHDLAWAILNAITSLACIIGPTLAVSILVIDKDLPLYIAIVIQLITLFGLLVFRLSYKHSNIKRTSSIPASKPESTQFLSGLKLWKVLNRKLYPILIFLFLVYFVDSTFWTLGAILVGENSSPITNAFYVVYLLPAFFIAPLGVRFSRLIGKKRTAFLGGLLAGTCYGLSVLVQEFNQFMIFIGCGSLFFAVTMPEIKGAIEDYCERLGHNSNTLVGLTSSMASLGYIAGPIISGAIATFVGDQKAFGIIGIILAISSLVLLLVTPRKIRLPQQQLANQY